MPVIEIEVDPKLVLKDKNVAVVVFYAPSCDDCVASETYEKVLSEEFVDQVHFYRFDAINNEEIADLYGIDKYPTYIIFRRGKAMHGVLIEPCAEGEVRNWLEIHLRSSHYNPLRVDRRWRV